MQLDLKRWDTAGELLCHVGRAGPSPSESFGLLGRGRVTRYAQERVAGLHQPPERDLFDERSAEKTRESTVARIVGNPIARRTRFNLAIEQMGVRALSDRALERIVAVLDAREAQESA